MSFNRIFFKDIPYLGPDAVAMVSSAFNDALGNIKLFDTIICRLKDDLDDQLTKQLNPILHAPEFRHLEAAWLGLRYLVSNCESNKLQKINVMNISREELSQHLSTVPWDKNALFEALNNDVFGEKDGEPYACIVGDFEFAHEPEDLLLLRTMGMIGATIHAPFIAGASARLFGAEIWHDVVEPDVSIRRLDDPDHAEWQDLREQQHARFLALCMPRLVARSPYGAVNEPIEEFAFEEDADARSGRNVLWMNAAYAMAVNMNRAQTRHGWCTRFRGASLDGGELQGLPPIGVRDNDGHPAFAVPSIEADISDRSDAGLAKAGLIAVVQRKNADRAFFLGAQSMYKPRRFEGDGAAVATALEQISARLPYMFPVYRFAHYLRVIVRDKAECLDASSLSRHLQAWLDGYVNDDPSQANEAAQAKQPLKAGQIDIVADESRDGLYQARLALRLLYQMEGLDLDIPLSWPLPASTMSARE